MLRRTPMSNQTAIAKINFMAELNLSRVSCKLMPPGEQTPGLLEPQYRSEPGRSPQIALSFSRFS